jgi:hypothetical protein
MWDEEDGFYDLCGSGRQREAAQVRSLVGLPAAPPR